MNTRPRFATFSLLLLFSACFLFWPLQPPGDRIATGSLAESFIAPNSGGLPQAAQPGQATGPESSVDEIGPLFPVEEHGKWGYIDKTGKIVISPQYYRAYAFHEGMA